MLLNQALDCVDITRWTGDRNSASFISGQLLLLHQILSESKTMLSGPPPPDPTNPNTLAATWTHNLIDASCFTPRLPDDLSIEIGISEASLILTVRTLEDADQPLNFGTKLAFAIGAQRRLEHDEMEGVYTIPRLAGAPGVEGGRRVRVKEKVRVESADPSLMAGMAKVGALEHAIGLARWGLSVVMGEENEDN